MSFVDDNNPYRACLGRCGGECRSGRAGDVHSQDLRAFDRRRLGLRRDRNDFAQHDRRQRCATFARRGAVGLDDRAGRAHDRELDCRSLARSATSQNLQYAGLALYVVAESVIFMPLLWIANHFFPGQNIIPTAGLITLILFGGLSAVVFLTKSDFSWLRGVLTVAGIAAFGAILCSAIFGFSLGILFTTLMIAFACGYILYDTSNILHHYRTDQYVAASLALFASVALLFWYVIQFVMQYTSND